MVPPAETRHATVPNPDFRAAANASGLRAGSAAIATCASLAWSALPTQPKQSQSSECGRAKARQPYRFGRSSNIDQGSGVVLATRSKSLDTCRTSPAVLQC